jgi:hypothetical protein
MLRLSARVIVLTAMIICLPMTAQAADETLTLACKGTMIAGCYHDASDNGGQTEEQRGLNLGASALRSARLLFCRRSRWGGLYGDGCAT